MQCYEHNLVLRSKWWLDLDFKNYALCSRHYFLHYYLCSPYLHTGPYIEVDKQFDGWA